MASVEATTARVDCSPVSKTLSENFPIDLEQRRISPRMDLPIVTVLKGDAPYEKGYHNQEGGLL
jgi:hypothetical protein